MVRVVFLLALLGTALAVPKLGSRIAGGSRFVGGPKIVGGAPTTVDQYPYITNMQYLWWFSWFQACGGSLITPTTVLSAAHCYEGDSPSEWRVRVGTSFASSGGVVHNVQAIRMHEDYHRPSDLNNDVAIIRLATRVTLSENVQLARVAGPSYHLPDGTQVTTLGWGTLTPQGSSPEQLHVVDLYTINQELCAERYAYLKTLPNFERWPDITPEMLCAGVLDVGGRDACQGDSGGPLAHDGDVIIGVVSWGYSCAHDFWPGVNARVSALSEWIQLHGAG